jgi:hypothetical protein
VSALEIPPHMRQLPRDHAGRPIPYFAVRLPDGTRDFRVTSPTAVRDAVRHGLGWVCGQPFLPCEDQAFTIGPMCGVTGTTAEPPCHVDCAVYSACACPFLVTPQMTRRERHIPEGTAEPAGIMIRRNPGVTLVWVTGHRQWTRRRDPGGGLLFHVGDTPKQALWFARGREATRAEVLASVESGLPILREMAEQDGPDAVDDLERLTARAMKLIPADRPASQAAGAAPEPSDRSEAR